MSSSLYLPAYDQATVCVRKELEQERSFKTSRTLTHSMVCITSRPIECILHFYCPLFRFVESLFSLFVLMLHIFDICSVRPSVMGCACMFEWRCKCTVTWLYWENCYASCGTLIIMWLLWHTMASVRIFEFSNLPNATVRLFWYWNVLPYESFSLGYRLFISRTLSHTTDNSMAPMDRTLPYSNGI